jgi:rootletin
LADSNFEKEKYHNTNKELRDHVKKIEGEKREQNRQLEEAFQKITSKIWGLFRGVQLMKVFVQV